MEGDYGYVEEHMLHDYTGIKPDLYKRYMDDVAGAVSCTEDDLTQSLTFASNLVIPSNLYGREEARQPLHQELFY